MPDERWNTRYLPTNGRYRSRWCPHLPEKTFEALTEAAWEGMVENPQHWKRSDLRFYSGSISKALQAEIYTRLRMRSVRSKVRSLGLPSDFVTTSIVSADLSAF